MALLHRFLLLGFSVLLKRQEGLKVWSFGLLINLLLTVCPLVTCVLEKDEAAIESSEFNATSVADVDKRVKRRLLMGNSFLPLSMCCHGACACIPDSTLLNFSLSSSIYLYSVFLSFCLVFLITFGAHCVYSLSHSFVVTVSNLKGVKQVAVFLP